MFSAIIGRFLTSIATWKLERGADFASMEHLNGCRTVSGVIDTSIRLNILHYAMPLLVISWTLSALRGQATLRVVSSGPSYTNDTIRFSYLDILSPHSIGESASTRAPSIASINAVFIGALIAPGIFERASPRPLRRLENPFTGALCC
ncbi:hypothetical protein Q7P37_001801 [Cladosporium fusiforme]